MNTTEQVTQDQEVAVEQQENFGLNELFADSEPTTVYGGRNQLDRTANLTRQATEICNIIMRTLNENGREYAAKVVASQKTHDAMDDLINELHPLDTVEADYLKDLDEEEIDKMIRSQQSKRSRAKNKIMTKDNYRTMMIGAIAENIIRITTGKLKTAGGSYPSGDVGYTEEDLEEFMADQEKLKKAIRNIQSKKSIMKAKAEFADPEVLEASPRWQQLLAAEEQLKAIRDSGAAELSEEAKQALEIKNQAGELLADVDVKDMDLDEAQRLLMQVQQMLKGQ